MTAISRLWRKGWVQAAVLVALTTVAFVVIWWRGPDWGEVWEAFRFVVWSWIVLAFALNVVSTLFRALSWRLTVGQALRHRGADPAAPNHDRLHAALAS